jgi:hypothetical protein
MGGSDNLDFIHKVQQSLKMDQDFSMSNLTFYVGVGKPSIDLPSQTLDVSSAKAVGVKVLLTADSDGIEGEVMRRSSPPLPLTRKGRGRQPKVRQQQEEEQQPNPPPPSRLPNPPELVNPTPSRFEGGDIEAALPAYLHCSAEVYRQLRPHLALSEEELARQVGLSPYFAISSNRETYKYNLNLLMVNYKCPQVWLNSGVDPVIAMMLTRKLDPVYHAFDIDVMLEVYSKLTRFEFLQQQRQKRQLEEQQQAARQRRLLEQQQAMDLNRSRKAEPDNRTNTELMNVRGNESGIKVLKHKHESQQNITSADKNSINEQSAVIPSNVRCRVKQEVLELPDTPMFVDPVDSVIPTSVYPAPPSVLLVADNLKSTQNGIVGEGNQIVTITYGKYHLGPIRLRNEQEVTLVTALAKERCDTAKHRGKAILKSPRFYAKAARARSLLSPDIVRYIDGAFTKKGLKEGQLGRKRTNHPKRSQVIKLDPITGQKIYPDGHPLHKNSKSGEIETKLEVKGTDDSAAAVLPEAENKNYTRVRRQSLDEKQPTMVVRADIDSILSLTMVSSADMSLAMDTSAIDLPMPKQKASVLSDQLEEEEVKEIMVPESPKRVTRNQSRKAEAAEAAPDFQSQRAQRKRRSSDDAANNKSTKKKPQAVSGSAAKLTVENLAMLQVGGNSNGPVSAVASPLPPPSRPATRKYKGYSPATVAMDAEKEKKPLAKPSKAQAASSIPKKQNSILRNIEAILSVRAEHKESLPSRASSPKKADSPPMNTKQVPTKYSPPDAKLSVTRNQSRRAQEESEELMFQVARKRSDPVSLGSARDKVTSSTDEVFVRHAQGDRIKKLLEKREKKKQLLMKYKSSPPPVVASAASLMSAGPAAAGRGKSKYRGYAKPNATAVAAEGKKGLSAMARRFSAAEDLGGVKKVIRNGQVIAISVERPKEPEPVAEEPQQPAEQPPQQQVSVEKKVKNPAKTTQEEQDLIAELFQIADDLDFDSPNAGLVSNAAAAASSSFIDTSSQVFEIGDPGCSSINYDFPTFDDLM